ncbi:hypothetical protein FRC15_002459, partial [Serendipita sp. 397]
GSNAPTILRGDLLLLQHNRHGEYQVGDIVVFKASRLMFTHLLTKSRMPKRATVTTST